MITITIDYRERRSLIPELLKNENITINFSNLKAGDYIINETLAIERKTSDDFINSIMNQHLFDQCLKLKSSGNKQLLLIEGNPYKTSHSIDDNAIRGAILSVLVSWQIPIIFTENQNKSVEIMMTIAKQQLKNSASKSFQKIYKPKNIHHKQCCFLQGIPLTGPILAERLMNQFGSIKSVINATEKELSSIKGIGKKSASKMVRFFEMNKK